MLIVVAQERHREITHMYVHSYTVAQEQRVYTLQLESFQTQIRLYKALTKCIGVNIYRGTLPWLEVSLPSGGR